MVSELGGGWFCNRCNAAGARLVCPQCRDAAWCTAACQKQDWLTHKGSCRERVDPGQGRLRGGLAPQAQAQAPREEPGSEGQAPAGDAWHPLPAQFSAWKPEVTPERECGDVGATSGVVRVDLDQDPLQECAGKPRVRGRVSVVVPTTYKRYQFHAQLWLCYNSQSYVDKELIVVDSGEAPSPFFQNRSGADVTYVHLEQHLSIGEKRNLAIQKYSTGEIIANFDDDDLYFPAYLQTMARVLTTSKAAVMHLNAWHVLDIEARLCAIVDPSKQAWLSKGEVGAPCGFSMLYTYAAWRHLPWPALSCGEDQLFLQGCLDVGLPVASRADAGRAMTVLHLQHGGNVRGSVCHAPRQDVDAVYAMIDRFEQACRRIIKLPQSEYDSMGGSLLCPRLFCSRNAAAAPPTSSSASLFLVSDGADQEAELARLEAWRHAHDGAHPGRKVPLREPCGGSGGGAGGDEESS